MVHNFFIVIYYLFTSVSPDGQNSFNDSQSSDVVSEHQVISTEESNNQFLSTSENNPVYSPTNFGGESGLIFEKSLEYRTDDNQFTDKIQLLGLTQRANAIQFRIQVNKTPDDSTILIFNSLEKGSDLSNPSWILDYNVIRGTIYPNGASKDEVLVLIFHVNQSSGLDPGDYLDLLKVNYTVAPIEELEDSVKSSFRITNAQASTSQGNPIDITPSRDEFKIVVRGVVPEFGLIFEQDTVYRLEDDVYVDNMKLINLEFKAQALQFRLLVNHAADDNVVLAFQNIQKGADIADPSWVLTYNVFKGPLTGNGASVDEIIVLLWNLNQNNGLLPGDYDELLKVKYGVVDLPALQDSIKSSIKISNAEASTYQGFPINITPSRDDLTVIVRNRVGIYGDVNGDGCLDLLDLILVVDHITGRDSLDLDEFLRADIAPWIPRDPEPSSDGVVNVQDLSLLHNILLSGEYPSGVPINPCYFISSPQQNLSNGNKVTFYITEQGITLYSDCETAIRGIQLEFGNIQDDPENMTVSTDLGQGDYLKVEELLRVLLYDRLGQKTINSGNRFAASLPFNISNPSEITIEKVIIIDINRQRLFTEDIEIEIIYGNPPFVPMEFILYQNYPNPFNPETTIEYEIPDNSKILLKVYDILGNEIVTLVDDVQSSGVYSVTYGENQLPSGIYFYRMIASSLTSGKIFTETKKMALIK